MGIQPIRKVVTPEIPDKLYFRIGDVARLCEVPAYVLRFWETEFPQLKPNKGGTGQRLYRKRDVEMALRIKSLLYDQGYTIPGARQVFKNEVKEREVTAGSAFMPAPVPAESCASSPVPARSFVSQPVAAPASEAMAPSPTPPAEGAGTEVRRQMQLRALREELRSLLTLLEAPLGEAPAAVKPPRPRLVLEPRPATPRIEGPRLEMLRLVRDPAREANQGDLFPGE